MIHPTVFDMVLCMLLISSASAFADEAAKDTPAQKRGRPSHSLDLSGTDVTGSSKTWNMHATLDDRLFTIGDDLPVYNTVRAEEFRTGTLPDVPVRLYTLSDTVMAKSDDSFFMGMISSPSDKPFHSIDEITMMGVAQKRIWQNGGHSLMAAVYISDTRYWGWYIPMPFITYGYKDDGLTVLAGIPTMVYWKLTKKLMFTFTYFPVVNIESSLVYRPLPFVSIGPEIALKQDKYLVAGREKRDERLYHRYLTLSLGAQGYLSSWAGIHLSAGIIPHNVWYVSRYSWDWTTPEQGGTELFIRAGATFFVF